jgi:ribosome-associated toxin RatA of RatAB toxin-antitoxin module
MIPFSDFQLWLPRLVVGFTLFAFLGCAAPPPVPERLAFLDYQGQVNEHQVVIQADSSQIFEVLTDFDRFVDLIPADRIQLSKVTPGPYEVGTVLRAETKYKIQLQWESQVVRVQKDRLLVLQVQDGPFRGGYEVWELKPQGSSTKVSHTLVYNISNFFYRLVWVLKRGEKKHNNLTEATLQNLKLECEQEHLTISVRRKGW